MGDQISHPYKATVKIIVLLYFNLYVFREEAARQKVTNSAVASTPGI
jgi:hypothetical protein